MEETRNTSRGIRVQQGNQGNSKSHSLEKAVSDSDNNKRRQHRVPLDQIPTEVEFEGQKVPVKICDLSEQGIRLTLDAKFEIAENDQVRIGVGRIKPNIQGRVRWIGEDRDNPENRMIGVEFESFLLEEPQEDEVNDLLEAWREISHSYNTFESFLLILEELDKDIINGRIEDLSEAIHSIIAWIDQNIGDYNLWRIIPEKDGSLTSLEIHVEHTGNGESSDEMESRVLEVAQKGVTLWFDNKPYLYGETVVAEFLKEDKNEVDLIQKLTLILGRRIQLWSKLLMKNISLQLLGDEVERLGKRKPNAASH